MALLSYTLLTTGNASLRVAVVALLPSGPLHVSVTRITVVPSEQTDSPKPNIWPNSWESCIVLTSDGQLLLTTMRGDAPYTPSGVSAGFEVQEQAEGLVQAGLLTLGYGMPIDSTIEGQIVLQAAHWSNPA